MGGSVFSFTAFKIEISNDGSNWCVYRRYNEFSKLHDDLVLASKGDRKERKITGCEVVFPAKNFKAGFSKDIKQERLQELQDYLVAILAIEGITTQSSLAQFLDLEHKGASGASKDIGQGNILLETFGHCKPCRTLIEIWGPSYLVLSKKGTLYAFKNVYDRTSDAIVAFPLSGAVRVFSPPGTRKVDLSCEGTKQRLVLKLSSEAEVATWLRRISDLTLREGVAAADAAKAGGGTPSSKGAGTPSSKGAGGGGSAASPTPPPVDIKTKGSGNTVDELSSMYGV